MGACWSGFAKCIADIWYGIGNCFRSIWNGIGACIMGIVNCIGDILCCRCMGRRRRGHGTAVI